MKNKKIVLGFLCLTLLNFSCKERKTNESNQNEKTEVTKQSDLNKYSKTHKTDNYSITIESNNKELSTIKISTEGLQYNLNESFQIEGQVIETYMTDLNKDGFKEFFLTIAPTDDTGNIEIIGYGSNSGISMSQITIRETKELKAMNTDKVTINENEIRRAFKVNGEDIVYLYNLVKGEASYILELQKQ